MAKIDDQRRTYLKWWQGKKCRLAKTEAEYKTVIDVRVYGPPSFVYGGASLVYDDGSEESIFTRAYIPRKYDVEVKPENNA